MAEIDSCKVGFAEVGSHSSMLIPPLIPYFYSLLEQVKMLLVCHLVLPLFLRICFEITEQSIQGFLVVVVLFPLCEVADIPGTPNVGGPTSWTAEDSDIQANRKQYKWIFLTLLIQGSFDFKCNPSAFDRMFR